MPDSDKEPLTKAEFLAFLRRFDEFQKRFGEFQQRVEEHFTELRGTIRDTETRLLSAMYDYARAGEQRLVSLGNG